MRRSSAFTLVEMLVVIAVIGILASLTIPAVVNSIATGRKMVCLHQLGQLGKGIHAYASTRDGALPPLRKQFQTPAGEMYSGWVNELLPYIDEQSLGDRVMEQIRAGQPISETTTIKSLVCLSDISKNSNDAGKLSYALNGGRVNNYNGNANSDYNANGVFMDQITSLGPKKFKADKVYLSDIADGATNTLMILETLDADCWQLLSEANLTTATAGANELRNSVIWLPDPGPTPEWVINNPTAGKMPYDGSTQLPAHPSSHHTNGFQAALCDASAKMYVQIDYRVYCQLMSSNGAKAYDPGIAVPANGPMPQPGWQSSPVNEDDFN